MSFPLLLWKYKYTAGLLLIVGVIAATIFYYRQAASIAEVEKQTAEIEKQRLATENEGYKTLQNTNTIAQEVENDQKIANQQAVNSNIAGNNFNDSVQRDSNAFSGNYADSKRRFCTNFPSDSRCQ